MPREGDKWTSGYVGKLYMGKWENGYRQVEKWASGKWEVCKWASRASGQVDKWTNGAREQVGK